MPYTEHEHFDVALSARDAGYDVTVTCVGGEFRGSFAMPFAPYEVENFLLRIGARRGVRRAAPATHPDVVRDFGARLFQALFHDDVDQALRESELISGRDERGVRIRLRLRDAPELAGLPWEYLYDPTEARPLAVSTQTPLVRYVDQGNPVRGLRVSPPLRILAVMSAPRGVEALDTTREYDDLQGALHQQVLEGRVEVHGLDHATPSRLRDQLGKDVFHIVHFMGHGAFDDSTGTGMVLLEDEDGRPNPLTGHDLGLVLHDHDELRMVVLNACEGGRGSQVDPVGGVAQSMVHQDIPAVVGMQAEITDVAATCFSEAFYRRLGLGDPVDVAMSEARMKLLLDGHSSEWGIPMLYLRAHDGRIFDLVDDPAPPDVERLEAEADDLVSEGTEPSKIRATGLYKRVLDLAPEHDEAGRKLAALHHDTDLVPDARPPGALPPGPPPPREPEPLPPPAPHLGPPDLPPPAVVADSPAGRPPGPPAPAVPAPTPLRASRMVARTQMVLARGGPLLDDAGRRAVDGLARALHEPLRIAITGRVGSGKSTLVNALVGRMVAPTDGGPDRHAVTWYRYGTHDRARLVLHDGAVRELEGFDGRPITRLPVPVDDVDRLEVWLPAPALRRQTLVDTPGLEALAPRGPSTTGTALLGRAADAGGLPPAVDAWVWVFRGIAEPAELRFLGRQLDTGGVLASAAVNAIGVFTQADVVGDGAWGQPDPLQVADLAARQLAANVPHRAADVVAVSGLMSQAARTGAIGDADAELLAGLADLPATALRNWRLEPPPGVAASQLEDLVTRCGPLLLVDGREEAGGGAAALSAWADRRSGVPELEDTIRRQFLGRAAALQADHTLAALARLAEASASSNPQAVETISAAIEEARENRDLHPIRELHALRQVAGLDPALHRELLRVSGAGSVPERLGADVTEPGEDLVEAAQHAASRAQQAVSLADDGQVRAAARVLTTSYRLLADEARMLQA